MLPPAHLLDLTCNFTPFQQVDGHLRKALSKSLNRAAVSASVFGRASIRL
jgi:hypothetical protein